MDNRVEDSTVTDQAVLRANVAMVLIYWGILVRALSVEWIHNSQYSYGWAILGSVVWMAVKRLRAAKVWNGTTLKPASKLILGITLVIWVLLQVVKEANPEWRFTLWLETGIVLTLTYFYFIKTGGSALWTEMGPVCLLFLTAVPWPTPIENLVVTNFTEWITAGVCEVLHIIGISAVSQGNVIKLLNGYVGVEEACSGIRSFQLAVALSALFATLNRMSVKKGLILAGMGAALAFMLNFGRTLALTLIYSKGGETGYKHWHDFLGFVVQVLLLGARWYYARPATREIEKEGGGRFPSFQLLPLRTCILFVALIIGTICFKEVWYRVRRNEDTKLPKWDLRWAGDKRFQEVPMTAETIASLKSSASIELNFNDEGKEWTLFFMRWKPGKDSLRASRAHNPTICLPASGFKLRSKGFKLLPCNEVFMPFETFTFEANQKLYYVFYCLWEDSWTFPRVANENIAQRGDRWWRLQVAWEGKRNLGQQAFEVAMTGYRDFDEAADALRQQLPSLINISK
jgi:exosortase